MVTWVDIQPKSLLYVYVTLEYSWTPGGLSYTVIYSVLKAYTDHDSTAADKAVLITKLL